MSISLAVLRKTLSRFPGTFRLFIALVTSLPLLLDLSIAQHKITSSQLLVSWCSGFPPTSLSDVFSASFAVFSSLTASLNADMLLSRTSGPLPFLTLQCLPRGLLMWH